HAREIEAVGGGDKRSASVVADDLLCGGVTARVDQYTAGVLTGVLAIPHGYEIIAPNAATDVGWLKSDNLKDHTAKNRGVGQRPAVESQVAGRTAARVGVVHASAAQALEAHCDITA